MADMEISVGSKEVLAAAKAFEKLAAAQEKASASTGRVTKATQDLDKARAQASGGGSGPPASARGGGSKDRFTSGPEQKLLDLKEQKARAALIKDMERRSAVLKDISRAEFLAQRSIKLHEKRMEDPDKWLNGKGLLELFSDLNSLMSGLRSGNLLGVSRSLMKGVDLVTGGGLNAEQKAARAGGAAPGGPQAAAGTAANAAAAATNAATAPPPSAATATSIVPAPPSSAAATAIARNMARAGIQVPLPALPTAIPAAAQGGGAAGGAALSGAAGLALGVGVAAVGLFALAKGAEFAAREIGEASERVGSFSRSMTVTGGTAAETARLGAIGADPGASNALRDRLTHDGLAAMTAMSMGVGPVAPQAYGPQDNAKLHQQLLQGLRDTYKMAGAEEALRKARLLGLDAELDLLKVSDRVWEAEKRQGAQRADLMNERTTQAARDLNAEIAMTGNHLEDLRTSFASPFLSEAAQDMRGLNNTLERLNGIAKDLGPAIELVGDNIVDNLFPGVRAFLGWMGGNDKSPKTAADAKDDLQKQHIRALQQLAESLNRAYGDHGRAGSAVPSGRQGKAAAAGLEGALAAMEWVAGPW